MPHLSHSQCETWSQCPLRWHLQRDEGVPQAPSEALILGDAIHQALEADGRAIMRSGKGYTLLTLQGSFEVALEERLEQDDPDGLIPLARVVEMKHKGGAILRTYVDQLQRMFSPQSVEESFDVDIPGAPGWKFTGRIDARSTRADGTEYIIDFKTGKPWEPGIEHSKPQANAYLWADAQQGGGSSSVVFCVFAIETDEMGNYRCTLQARTTTRTDDQLAGYVRYLSATVQQMKHAQVSGEYPARTGPLCGWCGVLGSCDAGQAWLKSKGRKPAIPVVSVQRVQS